MSGSRVRYLNRLSRKNYSIRYFLNFKDISSFKVLSERFDFCNSTAKFALSTIPVTTKPEKLYDVERALVRSSVLKLFYLSVIKSKIYGLAFRVSDDFCYLSNEYFAQIFLLNKIFDNKISKNKTYSEFENLFGIFKKQKIKIENSLFEYLGSASFYKFRYNFELSLKKQIYDYFLIYT